VAAAVFTWPEAVVILSSRDDVVAGMDPQFVPQWGGPHWVIWQESHERVFLVDQVLEEDAEHYKFRDVRGDTFELRPMTLELYEKHVRLRTVGKKRYETVSALVAAMRHDW
jgi:hypothetical protein